MRMILAFAFFLFLVSRSNQASFKSIISFGDSLADTGASIHLSPSLLAAAPPYGETFFHRPTGRWSDGRLIIDFTAESLGIPYLQPFRGEFSGDFSSGVNFAVGGCTALPVSLLSKEGLWTPSNVSLATQLSWFKESFLPIFCHTPLDCRNFIETSLVLVGEIGVNDYNYAFLQGKSDLVQSFIPKVIQEISLTIKEMIKLGATTIMAPGTLPFGCSAILLTYFQGTNHAHDYDPKTGCLNWLNTLSQHHNELLQMELQRIRHQNPNITIIYADYYNSAMPLFRNPQKYGFAKGALTACCGGGGTYNADPTAPCGIQGSNLCEDPSLHVSWDGLHLTEAAYRFIANQLLRGSFTFPPLNTFLDNAAGFSDDH